MARIDSRLPDGATEITTGQANRAWYIGEREPYPLKRYSDPARAANEAAALVFLTRHGERSGQLIHPAAKTDPAPTA
ncbi:hypothetical protein C1I97_30335 [Streptomyces sp. NTH33]|uniref:hypothetical protein n=1 Tax=Streptomyces sp. NTH33 TaxID=1735453 RepID=UPI000DA896D6|nr:hypothetical protein [Streptomyces sp. NTH33]PZG90856.1 hypothetical protein C1I97_30335 [Streptomyces sp. NTH33]